MGTVFSNGKIDIATLQTLCNTITQIQPAIAASAARVDALGAPQLEQLKEPLSKAKTTLDSLDEAATGLAKVAPSLPAMLGANGTRNYLVIAQNNSEIRSTGGFPGSRMLMTIDNGQIELESFEAVGTHFPAGTIPLTDEEYAVVNDLMQTGATFAPGDVNAVPSFPRAAQLMEWCWEEEGNDDVDGVIAIDPVFLQSLLALTGGVTTSDGTVVDGTNAAQILLNETYYLPTDEQDPFFSEVAGLAVKKIMGSLGSVSMTDLATTLTAGTEQGRFLLYMDDPTEEATITDLGADGEVNQDATAKNIQDRGLGFINKLAELCKADGKKVAVTGNEFYVNNCDDKGDESTADVIIEVSVPAQTTVELCSTEAQTILSKEDTIGIFGSNQVSAEGVLAADANLSCLGSNPDTDVIGIGFDAGSTIKAAVTDGTFIGAVTQSPLMMGYYAIYAMTAIANGDTVEDMPMPGYWYDSTNMDDPTIKPNLYD